MDVSELLPGNQKDFKGFKTIKEIKLKDTQMFLDQKKNGAPDKIITIFMRRNLNDVSSKLKDIYK